MSSSVITAAARRQIKSPTQHSTVSLSVRAGTRCFKNPGLASILASFGFSATGKRSSLATIRQAELAGGILSAQLTREHLILNAHFLNGDEELFVDILKSQLESAKLSIHEFNEQILPHLNIQYQQFLRNPNSRAIDAFHSVAFRNGLGNSMFINPSLLRSVTAQQIKDAHKSAFDLKNIAFLTQGQTELHSAVSPKLARSDDDVPRSGVIPAVNKTVQSSFNADPEQPSKYFGGEQRIPFEYDLSQQVVVFGYGLTKSQSSMFPALQVLSSYLGGVGQIAPYTSGTLPLSKLLPSSMSTPVLSGSPVTSFAQIYSDAAVFGIQMSGLSSSHFKEAGINAVKALKEIATSSPDQELVKGAIARVKLSTISKMATREGWAEFATQQLGSTGKVVSPEEVTAEFDKVDAKALSQVATALLKVKPTIVSVGDVTTLPYGDEFGL